MFSMFGLLLVFVVRLSTCHNTVDVEYSEKVISDRKNDWFGNSLATSGHMLVVGAPMDDNHRGSITVMEDGVRVRVKGPEKGGEHFFGYMVDVNQHFMVVNEYYPMYVYVYQYHSPYDMVARIPTGDAFIDDIVISDDNTIAVSLLEYHDNWLAIYQYDGSSTWNIAKKFKLEDAGVSPNVLLGVHGDIIVVGVTNAFHEQGCLRIFNRVGGEWARGQTIQQGGSEYFG